VIHVIIVSFKVEVRCKPIIILINMKKSHRETIKVRILKLATLRSTGPPAELAVRLEIGERSVKRLVKEMRDQGTGIRYSLSRRSYVTEEDFQ
jgi:biotin operon repressor